MRLRPLAVFGAVLGTLTAAVAVPSAANAATAHQNFWVPAGKRLVLHGHGYGHGHGMSQYGAQGAARQGLDYREILRFYYPGTELSRVSGRIRVLITADTSSDLEVSARSGLRVRDRGNGTTYRLPSLDGVDRWRLAVGAGNRTVVEYQKDGWHRWDGAPPLTGDGEFHANGPITLWTPSGSRRYRGILRSASPEQGSADRDTVNVVSMDAYVRGVIPREMPPSWEPAAVRAQAVAARTYGAWSRAQNMNRYYQVCDTTSCQVYGGADAEHRLSNAAVRATSREILRYHGKPAFTQFSSSNGGWTAAGSVPYLPARKDPYDGFDGNPVHDWTVTVSARRLEEAYPQIGRLRRIRVRTRDGHGAWRGRVGTVILDGTRGNVRVTGDDLRWTLGLRSNWFTVERTPIWSRYRHLGAGRSPLGRVKSRQYAVAGGSVQRFAHGRIYYSRKTGARELYGPILADYRARGGVRSELGYPVSGVQDAGAAARVQFQHGILSYSPDTRRVSMRLTS